MDDGVLAFGENYRATWKFGEPVWKIDTVSANPLFYPAPAIDSNEVYGISCSTESLVQADCAKWSFAKWGPGVGVTRGMPNDDLNPGLHPWVSRSLNFFAVTRGSGTDTYLKVYRADGRGVPDDILAQDRRNPRQLIEKACSRLVETAEFSTLTDKGLGGRCAAGRSASTQNSH
jgi:hypothetical protein